MATATTKHADVEFVLTLTAVEAQYVEAALYRANPKHLDTDTVWDALHAAMQAAGVEDDSTAVF